MIRLIQRRLIIPRGDTGTFQIPMLQGKNSGDASIFTIFDPLIHRKVFEKQMTLSDGVLNLSFSHGDTVNLPVGQYVWDIKFYTNPQFADEQLISGEEIDSYYAAFALPVCEIRETGDNLLMSDDAPQATLAPGQIDLITAVLQEITGAKDVAVASRDSAIDSAREAETSATQAEAYASDALGYKNDTLAAKDEALQAAIDATTQATNAAQSAANALQSASDADASATAANAAKEAAIAAQNTTIAAKDITVQAEADASAHKTSAGNSATLAANSASAAGLSERNAQNYANAAALSEANAKSSETNAAGSATAAAASAQQAQATAQAIHEEIPTKVSDLIDDSGHYIKPAGGIPASDLAETYLTQHQDISGKANSSDLAAVATSGSYNDLLNKPTIPDIQIDSTSIVENGVANIPVASSNVLGVVGVNSQQGITLGSGNNLEIYPANNAEIKSGNQYLKAIVPSRQENAVFYGLAKAAGADESTSPEVMGTYREPAKTAIRNMIGAAAASAIPTLVSQLTNDSGYLTSYTETDPTVPAWAKAATKPTYTAAEVGAPTVQEMNTAIGTAIGNINSFDMAVVQALPTEDISTHTIYLVPKTGETNDVYDEYVYINNNWEMVGNTQIDLSNYVQKTDYASNKTAGIIKIGNGLITLNNTVMIMTAPDQDIKIGTNFFYPITPGNQDYATFYGLAKAAGDITQSQSNNTVGTYTAEAKAAIQNMLNVPDISNLPIINNNYGVAYTGKKILTIMPAAQAELKAGTTMYRAITPIGQHMSVFYGLAKAAGDSTQSSSDNAVGTYTIEAKSAIQTMLDVPSKANLENLISIGTTAPTTSDSKIWIDTDDTSTVQVPTVAEMEAGLAAKVSDVQVNGISVVSSNVANIPIASETTSGVIKVNNLGSNGVIVYNGELKLAKATNAKVKAGTAVYSAIVPSTQHQSVFYGLAKVAGTDLANEEVTLGTYPATAKSAIQTMLGITDALAEKLDAADAGLKVVRLI